MGPFSSFVARVIHMKQRLPDPLPTILLLGIFLFLLAPPTPLLAQESRRSDASKTTRPERTERSRTTSREREVESRSSRADSDKAPARRAPAVRADDPAPSRGSRRVEPARRPGGDSRSPAATSERSRQDGANRGRVRVITGGDRGDSERTRTGGERPGRDAASRERTTDRGGTDRGAGVLDARGRASTGGGETVGSRDGGGASDRGRNGGGQDDDRGDRDRGGREEGSSGDGRGDERDRDRGDNRDRDGAGRDWDGRDGDRDRAGRDWDGRDGDRDRDGRSWDDRDGDRGREWDGRDRDRDRRDRDYRDGDRRHDGGPIIIDRYPRNNHWGRPRIHVDIQWPWVYRHQRKWSPRYRYRQTVFVDVGWSGSHRESRLDLRTYYRHRVIDASPRRAVVDIQIDHIEIYEDGYFIGEVRHIPDELARIRAVVDRRRGVEFDRDVFLLGDPYAGFEMISTRSYDGFVLNKYRRSHGVRVGALDLRRERVVPVRRSKFFDPYDFSGFVPMDLLPQDAGWLIDYGYDSYSGHYWGDDDRYYYGFSDTDDYTRFDDDRAYYSQTDPRGATTGRDEADRVTPERQALSRTLDETYETQTGATIRLKRESFIERIE